MVNNKKGIVVLSLFDGISCGYLALERAGIPIEKYYASEIEPNAIKISNKNFPQIIQLGDIRLLDKEIISKIVNIMVRQSRQSGVARATCPD